MDGIIEKLYKIAELEDDNEIEEIADKLEELKDYMVLDIDNFKRELEMQGLMTEELINFIDNYMKWDNR